MSGKLVEVEYLKDVTAYAGLQHEEDKQTSIAAGTKRRIDAGSARQLVDKQVVKLVGDADEKKAARQAVKDADQPAATEVSANVPTEGGK